MTTSTPTSGDAKASPLKFSAYQKTVVAILAFLQFAVILDFMLMAPLGAVIMPTLGMSASQFGLVVSAYAFSAGVVGLLTAGFAARYDRKKLLLFFVTEEQLTGLKKQKLMFFIPSTLKL